MSKLKLVAIAAALTLGISSCVPANAGLNVFTEHQVVHMVSHGVNKYDDVRFPTGNYPYLGQIGIEYERKNISYSISYLHRSNVDITHGDEYNYNGIALGIKLKRCIFACR